MDAPTFEQVVAESRRPLTTLATRVLGDASKGEEIAQDALAMLYREWDRVENPAGFARTVVQNRCRDIQRHEIRARAKAPLLQPIADDTASSPPYLGDVLAKLSQTRREIVVLRFYGGHTLPEIARITGRALGTVKSNLARALDELREELSEVIEPAVIPILVAA